MTDQVAGHGEFDELAAGYALHALEPADEQRVLRHAAGCGRCARAIAVFREVAATLAEAAPAAEPDPRLGQRILAAVRADLNGRNSHGGVAGLADGWPRDVHAADENGTAGAPWPQAAGPGVAGAGAGGPGVSGLAAGGPGGARAGVPRHAAPPPPPRSRSRRRPRLGSGPGRGPQPGARPGSPRPQWLRRPAAAVAAVLIAVGGVWAGLAVSRGGEGQAPYDCAHLHGCSEVALTIAKTGQVAAKVVVQDGKVWLVPSRMPPDDPADQIYVLWQVTGAHTLAVGSFDVRAGAHAPIRIGDLAAPYGATWAFAISVEHGRAIPSAPSHAMALGQVS